MMSQKEQILKILVLCIPALFFVFNPAKFPADDGFFYPQIAYNFVQGNGMKFNDIYTTNGFHPLWMVFCVVAECLNFFGKQNVIYILWVFQVFFLGLGFKLLTDIFFKNNLFSIFALGFLSLVFLSLGTIYLTEAHLNFLCLIVLLSFLAKNKKNEFIFGFLCSLVFLVRLDNVFIIAFLGLYFWKEKNYSITSLSKMLISFSVLVLPYLFSNYYYFGDLVPISGKVKSSFPDIQETMSLGYLPRIFFVITIFYLLLLFFKPTNYKPLKVYFALGSLVFLFYNLVFQSQLGQWYYVPQMILTSLLIYDLGLILPFKIFDNKILMYANMFVLAILLSFIGYLKLSTNLSIAGNILSSNSKIESKSEEIVETSIKEFSKVIPKDSRIYVYDFPGKFAFYSNFSVIPADGLVANKEYFNEMKPNNFRSFFNKNRIQYLLLPSYFKPNNGFSFIGINIFGEKNDITYYLKNSLEKKVIDTLWQKDLQAITSHQSPLKHLDPSYDSIKIFKLVE